MAAAGPCTVAPFTLNSYIVKPAVAVKIILSPAHTVVAEADKEPDGTALTVIVMPVVLAVQKLALLISALTTSPLIKELFE